VLPSLQPRTTSRAQRQRVEKEYCECINGAKRVIDSHTHVDHDLSSFFESENKRRRQLNKYNTSIDTRLNLGIFCTNQPLSSSTFTQVGHWQQLRTFHCSYQLLLIRAAVVSQNEMPISISTYRRRRDDLTSLTNQQQ